MDEVWTVCVKAPDDDLSVEAFSRRADAFRHAAEAVRLFLEGPGCADESLVSRLRAAIEAKDWEEVVRTWSMSESTEQPADRCVVQVKALKVDAMVGYRQGGQSTVAELVSGLSPGGMASLLQALEQRWPFGLCRDAVDCPRLAVGEGEDRDGDPLPLCGEHLGDRWLVYTTAERGDGDVYLWWRAGRSGYTTRVDMAGQFTEAEAKAIHGWRDRSAGIGDFMVPAAEVARFARTRLEIGSLPRLEGARW